VIVVAPATTVMGKQLFIVIQAISFQTVFGFGFAGIILFSFDKWTCEENTFHSGFHEEILPSGQNLFAKTWNKDYSLATQFHA
jgi:hypothetical protein